MRDMLLSRKYLCAGTLLTLVFSMLLGNRRSPRSGALFCASMALLGAVVLQILKTYYEGAGFDIQIPAISAMCAGLTVLCAAALLTISIGMLIYLTLSYIVFGIFALTDKLKARKRGTAA